MQTFLTRIAKPYFIFYYPFWCPSWPRPKYPHNSHQFPLRAIFSYSLQHYYWNFPSPWAGLPVPHIHFNHHRRHYHEVSYSMRMGSASLMIFCSGLVIYWWCSCWRWKVTYSCFILHRRNHYLWVFSSRLLVSSWGHHHRNRSRRPSSVGSWALLRF